MLFLRTNRLLFWERISLMKMRFFQRIWRIMLFLYLYQTYIIQYWTSKWWYVWNVIQTLEPHYISTRVGRKKSWIYTIFRVLNFSTTHGNRQYIYQTLISCNKNAGITHILLLEAFSDLADGLITYIMLLCYNSSISNFIIWLHT